jgi:short-subunit dehydrogenase
MTSIIQSESRGIPVKLEASVALVTGASSGIGEATAERLAAAGYKVYGTSRRVSESGKRSFTMLPLDVTRDESVEAAVRTVVRSDGRIDLLVNNAGFGTRGEFATMPLHRELEELDLNIKALVRLTHAALGPMLARKRGNIINVGSTGSFQPVPYMSLYAATKAFVLHFSEGVHEEAKKHGVTVTCLCPGYTATEFQKAAGIRKTGMLARLRPMPAEAVARIGYRGLMAGRRLVVPGWGNRMSVFGLRFSPRWFTVGAASWLQRPR